MDETAQQPARPARGLLSFLSRTFFFFLQIGLIVAAGCLSFDWLMESFVHGRQEIDVPELGGKTLPQAVDVLSRLNLAIAKESEEFAPDKPFGAIVKQFPLAGSKVREGKIVRVVTSLGSEKVMTPELIGLPLRKADIEIRAAGLALGETNGIFSLKHPKSYVVDQDPKPLSLMEKGELINLVISQGEPPADKLIVPDFAGKTSEEAQSWAKENGLEFRMIEEWEAQGAADQAILRQNMEPDTILDREPGALAKTTLEVTIARSVIPQSEAPQIEYTTPPRPNRQRELVLKLLTKDGERQIYSSRASPGQKVNIPIQASWTQSQFRVRIYLDGVFTEERTLQ